MVANLYQLGAATESYTARLREAGWRYKERLGKRIWRHPQGGWYSEEMAVQIAARERREGNGEE